MQLCFGPRLRQILISLTHGQWIAAISLPRNVQVTLGEYPEKSAESTPERSRAEALKGLAVQNLTPEIARRLGLPAAPVGVVITSVDPSSAAAAAGIERGDVIQAVNRKPVRNLEQYQQQTNGTGDTRILLLVNRGGTTHFVVVQTH